MKILITAGGTAEKIDEVRCLTNHSTGALGSAVADAFLRPERDAEVCYVCGETAMTPAGNARILRVSDVASLEKTLRLVLTEEKVDGVVHCMAVSDYTVDTVTSSAALLDRIADGLPRLGGDAAEIKAGLPALLGRSLHATSGLAADGKISSEMDDLILVLKKTPKIIGLFKALQPGAVLVGFKLLNRAAPEALIGAGTRLMARNGCDFVFANDKADVTPEHHRGYLIRPDGSAEPISGRERIAEKIASCVTEQILRRRA